MKIIKDGIKPEERVYRVECFSCGCVFEFARYEATYTSDPRDGDFLSISCPCCSRIVTKTP